MTVIEEKELNSVSGGGISEILTTDDMINYIQLLSERPGIIERLRMSCLSEEDDEAILRHFNSIDKFVIIARFAHNRTVDELMAIAAANDKK